MVIRDGQKQCYEDRWASPCRELLWGADDLEEWLAQGYETDYDPEELSGGVVLNFDSREVLWFEREAFEIPRVQIVHQKLMEEVWPDFSDQLHVRTRLLRCDQRRDR